jgi:hypothetical protein
LTWLDLAATWLVVVSQGWCWNLLCVPRTPFTRTNRLTSATMIALFCLCLTLLVSPFKSKGRLEAENAALRHRLIILRRKVRGRVRLTDGDRLFFIQLCCDAPIRRQLKQLERTCCAFRRPSVHGAAVTTRLRAMGIRDKPIVPGSPCQHGLAERLIGSIRLECVDHIFVLGEAHLRRTLK